MIKGIMMSVASNGLKQPAYEYISEMILTKQLMPGDRIPELKIAKEFGISRTPVRDAMRLLANEGLITIYPNRFAKVAEYSADAIRDIGVLRIALDSMAVKLAILYGSQADFLNLRQIAQNCLEALQAGNHSLRRRYDSDFHMELAKISRNELLMKFQKELYIRVQFIILHHPNPVDDEKRSLNQHFAIVDALRDHDEQTAMAIIVDHLTSFYDLKNKFPDNFFNNLTPDCL